MNGKYRLGIDAGGTFTDFVLAERDGPVRLFKAPSTPHDGTIAISNGLAQIGDDLGITVRELIQQADLCINGTTVALNALIEKKGVKIGLLCTAGHEDSIEIRLGHKEEGYRYDAAYPPAFNLVPRHLRCPIHERVLSDGSIRTHMRDEEVRAAVAVLKREGVRSVAISFLWSIANPEHERRAAAIVREMMPDAFVCCGSEVYPQVREYTRTSTTVVNAYLSPVMGRYVAKIDDYFHKLGARHPVRYFQSNGGLALGRAMRDRAVNAINSGPASAPQAGLFMARPFGIDNVISVDMGGTSFDITLTRNGETNVNKNVDFLRYRIGVPMIQVETLGAGGGSIARVNSLGMLEVGPESAGADPGPVCYGKGGSLPTVTDANVVLGYLDPDTVLGGSIRLDREAAAEAIRREIAEPLGISVEKAAFGISTIVNINMVNGIRRVSIERGYDPRDFALVCAGGAAGMHICALAEEMGIDSVIVPKVASGLCAFGQIISDMKYNYLATHPMRLDAECDLGKLNHLFEELEHKGIADLTTDGFTAAEISTKRTVEMRYVGQIHECSIDVPGGVLTKETVAGMLEAFHSRYEALYTYSEPHNPVELVNLECSAIGHVAKPGVPELPVGDGDAACALVGHRTAWFDSDAADPVRTPIYDGGRLVGGCTIQGPAIVAEATTSLVVLPGWSVTLDRSGSYLATRNRAGDAAAARREAAMVA
jgi:N-methylhydantoinase A